MLLWHEYGDLTLYKNPLNTEKTLNELNIHVLGTNPNLKFTPEFELCT